MDIFIQNLISKAVSGDNQAQYELSLLFSKGKENSISDEESDGLCVTDEIKKDEVQSFYWLVKAAENGHQQAMIDVADFYSRKKTEYSLLYSFSSPIGIAEYYDSQRGYWLKKAADLGNVKAEYKYALHFYNACTYQKAFSLFKLAASNGYLPAINYLGNCYYFGRGVEKDYKKAVKLFEKASTAGNWEATENLAMCYMKGNGVEANKEKMKELFDLAKSQKSFEKINK